MHEPGERARSLRVAADTDRPILSIGIILLVLVCVGGGALLANQTLGLQRLTQVDHVVIHQLLLLLLLASGCGGCGCVRGEGG